MSGTYTHTPRRTMQSKRPPPIHNYRFVRHLILKPEPVYPPADTLELGVIVAHSVLCEAHGRDISLTS
eukprot:6208242-Pleurochrysis_carterae.AAC.3